MKKWILVVLGAVLLFALAVAALLLFSRPQTITLADGTRMTLMGVSYGKKHQFNSGNAGQQLLTLMARLLRRSTSPVQQMRRTTTNDTLMIWLKEESPGKAPVYSSRNFIVMDDAGRDCAESSWETTAGPFRGLGFDAFPRRGKDLRIAIYTWGQHGRELIKGQFTIPNPARGPFPTWQPDPPGTPRRDGDVEFTLTRLVTGLSESRGEKRAMNAMDSHVLAAFHVTQNDNVLTNWEPVHIELADATGNFSVNRSWSNERDHDDATLFFQRGLWADEPAWKLRVEFSRTTGFADEELWTVADIPITTNQAARRNWSVNAPALPGFATTNWMGTVASVFPANKASGMGEAEFKVSLKPEPKDLRLTLISITDDQGRKVQRSGASWGGGEYTYGLDKLKGAQSITITVALHRSKYATFTAKPTQR